MEHLNTEMLSRVQFAFTVSFHIIFPSITIGLATLIAIWEGLWLKTHDPRYLQLAKFWIKPFAITFGMGVVGGIVMSYEFGTNFSKFSEIAGPVLGPLLVYEVLTAFFLEAGFLGVMLFGWQRVGPKVHFISTLVVAIGTWISSTWIMAANSWMQTPAGYKIVNGVFHVDSWMDVIFNPSFPYRVTHMLLASFITACLLVAGVSAFYLLKKQHTNFAKKGLSMTMWMLLVLTLVQVVVGDQSGLEVKEHQPAKLAAIEGIWEAKESNVPLLLFAIPNMKTEQNDYQVGIPHLGSLILTHSFDGAVTGLKAFPKEDRPYAPLVFWSFRIMVGLGIGMVLIALAALVLRRKGKLYENKWFLRAVAFFTPMGVVSTIAGWYVAEVGRQPWVVYNLVRTADVVSPLPAQRVLFTLIAFVIIYSLLGLVYLYFMRKLIRKGPPKMATLEKQLIGMNAPGYALAWVKNLKHEDHHQEGEK
ncbi:Cytochrome bd-II ubiquinol oxidase subunit 1 [Marinomonas spartinae]|uniref:Cytochrome bd-II ubiquinol oxidase subunit 1 n=1 Tax=Marinomonas spartinae TaxID=1792290 RepID=A0A1A8TSF5_9GAMM|nr:cytochrome ubiquinol oxidase subunit I [Marinomonas spartinae]SBS37652.1 Cytochrome bd-II ubiquinol oxidase subunit 1 [Marinomonas spartinae]